MGGLSTGTRAVHGTIHNYLLRTARAIYIINDYCRRIRLLKSGRLCDTLENCFVSFSTGVSVPTTSH